MGVLLSRRAPTLFLIAVVAVTIVRLLGLGTSRVEFYVDEAQYWFWSLEPAWGYFSKPPMIGWLAAGAQAACGSGEACLRTPSVLAWGLTALFAYGIAATLYGRRIALIGGLAVLLAPGAAFSSRILSTDAPLLTFWSLALLAAVQLRTREVHGRIGFAEPAWARWAWAAALGVGVGLGLLTKYAMIYFVAAAVVATIVDAPFRRALISPRGAVAALIAAAMIAPNLIWNLSHGLSTLKHTADNVSGSGLMLSATAPLLFLMAQALLAGPVIWAGYATAVMGRARAWAIPEHRLMLIFSLPIMAGLTIMATFTKVNGNWGAAALIGVFVLGAAMLVKAGAMRWVWAGLALGAAFQIGLIVADANADRLSINGRAVYARTLGGQSLYETVRQAAEAAGPTSVIVVETRAHAALLSYYGRMSNLRVRSWPAPDRLAAQDHFQDVIPLRPGTASVLAVAVCDDPQRFTGWGRVIPLGARPVMQGPEAGRPVYLFRLEQPQGPIRRPRPCA